MYDFIPNPVNPLTPFNLFDKATEKGNVLEFHSLNINSLTSLSTLS